MKHQRKHHFLAACRVTFQGPKGEIGVSEHNAVLIQDRQNVSMKGLGQIQQMAQLHFRQNVTDDPAFEVRDVFILGLTYLGHMNENEWRTTTQPEHTAAMSSESRSDALLNPADPLNISRGEQHVSATTGGDG